MIRSLLAVALLLPLPLPLPLAAEPLLVPTQAEVAAAGLTPGGRVVWFGIVRSLDDGLERLTHVRREATADREGRAVLAVPNPGPAASWAVVDVATGQMAAARTDRPELAVTTLLAESLQRGTDGGDRLLAERLRLDLLLVRPGVGAWGGAFGDGGAADEDGQSDGLLTAALAGLVPIGQAPAAPQTRAQAADLLLALDPDTFDLFALRLP
jgi:hypothetical protein